MALVEKLHSVFALTALASLLRLLIVPIRMLIGTARLLLPQDLWGFALLLIAVLLAGLLFYLRSLWHHAILLPVLACVSIPAALLFSLIVILVQIFHAPRHPGPLLLHVLALALALLPPPLPAEAERFFWTHQADYDGAVAQILSGQLAPDDECSRFSSDGYLLPPSYRHLTTACVRVVSPANQTVVFQMAGQLQVLVYAAAESDPCLTLGADRYAQLTDRWQLCQYPVWPH